MSWFEKVRTTFIEALDIHDVDEEATAECDALAAAATDIPDASAGEAGNANEIISDAPKPMSNELAESLSGNTMPTTMMTSDMELSSNDTAISLPDSIVVITSNEPSEHADSEEHEFEDQLSSGADHVSHMQNLNDSTKTVTCLSLSSTDSAEQSVKAGADSDSTQSFEDIQMLSPTTRQKHSKSEKPIDLAVDHTHSYSSTSSDIEVLSNPNGGDTNSTNSTAARASPAAILRQTHAKHTDSSHSMIVLKAKGHHREPSEVSVLSEDSEFERLANRIAELNHVIEIREQRLLQSERQNSELQERNQTLEATLEALRGTASQTDAAHETVQQLSALEKKFQASIRERDALRIQIRSLSDELHSRIPVEELNESKEMIAGLQSEGEKLSKEILQQSNIIKKLRAKEKTSDTLLKKNAEQISVLTSETDRLKKTLSAKEELERAQIDALHKLSQEKRKIEEEHLQGRSQIEDLQSKLMALQQSLDSAKYELKTRTRQEQEQYQIEQQELVQQVADLREQLRSMEQTFTRREQQLRDENRELIRRVDAAELRAESSTQDISLSTAPLIRQIESLQRVLNQRTNAWQLEEQSLRRRLETSQLELKSIQHLVATHKDKEDVLLTRCHDLEQQLSSATLRAEHAELNRRQTELRANSQAQEFMQKITELEAQLSERDQKVEAIEERAKHLELTIQQNERNAERMHELSLSAATNLEATMTKNTSPVRLQHGRSVSSLADSCGNDEISGPLVDWRHDDLDCVSISEHRPASIVQGVHLNLMTQNTTTLEHLQSLLKQRDGELLHLQWELSRVQAERTVLGDEITTLTVELENAKEKLQMYEPIVNNFEDLQNRYDALLEMYGEKVERSQELELDLKELKQAYKLQINELLARPKD